MQIHAEHSVQRVLELVVGFAREIIEAQYAAIGILDESGTNIQDFHTSGLDHELVERIGGFPTGKGVLGTVIRSPRPLRIRNITDHPDSTGFPEDHPHMTSFLGVPVTGRRGPIGNLYLAEKLDSREFTEEDESIAVMFAAQVAVAVDNARLYEETNRLLAEIKDLHTAREKFSSTINHELRNAITAVHGWSDLLLRKLGTDAPQAALEVFESAENTLELLDDLLLLNKLDAGRIAAHIREFDYRDVERRAIQLTESAARENEVEVAGSSDATEIICHTDPKLFERVLANLIANGIRLSSAGATVTVAATSNDRSLQVAVTNSGEGIDPELQETIFEDYVQGDTSRERGIGLALPVAKRLARFLGGDISVISQAGSGATFTLKLPRELPTS